MGRVLLENLILAGLGLIDIILRFVLRLTPLDKFLYLTGLREKGSDMKVLVVDDERTICEFLSKFLSRKGYTVRTASGGEEAIRLIKEMVFDAIFLDLRMPQVGGHEVLTVVKKIFPETAVIMMSGAPIERKVEEALAQESYAFIYKPFDLDGIDSIMRTISRKRKVTIDV